MAQMRVATILPTLVLFGAVAVPAVAVAQLHVGEYAAADVQRGAQLFATRCTTCHGDAGNQVPGVSVLTGSFRRTLSDEQLARIIKSGLPGTAMPQGNYSEAELTGLVAYLRSAPTTRSGEPTGLAKGNPAKGAVVFHTKGQCGTCHRVDGVGGFRGPNLSAIGSVRTDQSLLQSLLDPSAEIIPLNQELRAVTRSGRTIIGRRMNEDTHSVQLILEEQGRLTALMKSDIRELAPVKTSPMPSYRTRLTDDELADILAYLRTLKPIE